MFTNLECDWCVVSFDKRFFIMQVQQSWKKLKLTKSQKLVSKVNIDVAEPDADYDPYGLRDASPRTKGVEMLNANGKKRASSGSAIDSQSVYAKVGNLID